MSIILAGIMSIITSDINDDDVMTRPKPKPKLAAYC